MPTSWNLYLNTGKMIWLSLGFADFRLTSFAPLSLTVCRNTIKDIFVFFVEVTYTD